MTAIPPNEVTAEDLSEWYALQDQLKALKAKEMLLRTKIAKGIFPSPVEGTNTQDLAEGWVIKCKHKINRSCDEAMLSVMGQVLHDDGIPMGDLIRYKPELVLSAYRKLSDEDRLKFDQVLVSKPGTPELEIMLPAKNRPAG